MAARRADLSRDGQRVLVGIVSGAQGLKGEVRIKSYTADPLDIAAYGPLETEDGRRVGIRRVRPGKGIVIAVLEGIADRDAVEALKNCRLYVDRDRVPETEDDEWYHADLIGLRVEDKNGTEIGTVTAVQDFGGGDLLEIALRGSRRTVLVPFTRAVVPVVDIDIGRVVIDPPAGLLGTEGD